MKNADIINFKPIVGFDVLRQSKIVFYYRNENSERKKCVIHDFEWFFLLKINDLNDRLKTLLNNEIKQTKIKVRTEKINDFIKVYCNKSDFEILNDVFIKENIQTYEADFSLTKRYLIDNEIKLETNLKTLYFDIETDDSIDGIVIGRGRILSWAGCDNDTGKSYFYSSSNEKKVITKLLSLFNKYDLIIGWNSKQFDIPFIIERIKINNIKDSNNVLLDKYHYFWKKIMHVDMMKRFISLYRPNMPTLGLTSFSLNEVSEIFLAERKVDRSEKVIELFNNNKEKLRDYNIQDVKLLYNLNKKLKVLNLMIKECEWTGTFINSAYTSELLDNYILRAAHKEKKYFKTKPRYDIEIERIKIRGAYIMKPKIGLYEYIRTMDVKSLYPSILIGWNISDETLVENISKEAEENFNNWLKYRKIEDIKYSEWVDFLKNENKKFNSENKYIQTANNQFFLKNKKSVIPTLINNLLNERKKYKKLLSETEYESTEYENAYASQYAIKVLANSLYGILADQRTRYFDIKIAEAITITGQFINRSIREIFEKKLQQIVIYSDTDSVFLNTEKNTNIKELSKNINSELTSYLNSMFNFSNNNIFVAYEKTFKKFLLLDKKKYVGHVIDDDGQKVDTVLFKGTENIRRNIIKYTKFCVKELLNLILIENKDTDYLIEWLKNRRREIYEEMLHPEDIALTIRLSKGIKEYKSNTPYVLLARKMIDNKEILDITDKSNTWGHRIDYIIDTTGKVYKGFASAVSIDDFYGDWDRERYWDVLILPPLLKILKAAKPADAWDEIFNMVMQKKIQEEAKKEFKHFESLIKKETKLLESKIEKDLLYINQ